MAIRVFLNTWTERTEGGTLHIIDPIADYLNNVSLSDPQAVFIHLHSRISAGNGNRPDKAFLVTVGSGNLTSTEWDTLGSLTGVRAVPPAAFDRTIASLNNPTKNNIRNGLTSLGIPTSTLDSAATVGGFLRNVLEYLGGETQDFGSWESLLSEWA